MPLKVEGDPGYGSLISRGPGLASSLEGSETVPLLFPDVDPGQNIWKPLTREELTAAAGGPGWKKFRSRLVLLFWLVWMTLLGAAVVVIVQSPRPVATRLHWWQKELFYQLQPALFLDVDSTGSGASSKLSDRLAYLKSLGVGVMILEGLFRQDTAPLNLTEIDLRLGTSDHFHHFISDSQEAGLRVILDLCELDLFRGSEVSNEIPADASSYVQDSLRYWLEEGVSGFRICDTDSAYSEKTLTEWRRLVKEFSTEDNERIVMVRQTSDSSPAVSVYKGVVNSSLVELVSRSLLPPSPHNLSAAEVTEVIDTKLRTLQGSWQSWTVDEDGGPWELQKVVMVLIMTLPGTPIITHGNEMQHTPNTSVHLRTYSQVKGNTSRQILYEERRSTALLQSLSRTRSREEALLYGSFTLLPLNSTSPSPAPSNSSASTPLAFLRSWGCASFLVLLNMGSEPYSLDTTWAPGQPAEGVFVTSSGLDRFGSVALQSIKLQPHEAIVIKLLETNSSF